MTGHSFHCSLPQKSPYLGTGAILFMARRSRMRQRLFHRRPVPHQQNGVDAFNNAGNGKDLIAFSYHNGLRSRQQSCFRRKLKKRIMSDLELHSALIDAEADEQRNAGMYIDLGNIPLNDENSSVGMESMNIQSNSNQDVESHQQKDNTETIEEWRSKYWIVLIDDEPAIRLAIGDYLHSMGYSVITACDGPMAFLEVMLWSCSWYLLEEGRKKKDGQECPPWIDQSSHQPWRLPNCIISDIRMPGGIDGVQLLELLRRPSPSPSDIENAEKEDTNAPAKKKKKKRGRPRKDVTDNNEYNDKDDFDLLDAIAVASNNDLGPKNERIVTPTDHAVKYLDAIRGCIEHFDQQTITGGQEGKQQQQNQQYPCSFEQIPVILLTAKAMVSDRIEGYKAGASAYLPKPFRPEELIGMVDNLMRKQKRERSNYFRAQMYDKSNVKNNADNEVLDLTPEEANDIKKELVEIKHLLLARLKQQTNEKKHMDQDNLISLLPEAIWMLQTGERRKKVFTKDHIRSILSLCFGITYPRNNTKRDALLKELEKWGTRYPEKLLSKPEQNSLFESGGLN